MAGPPQLAPEGQTYCLRWNNHKSNLVEILDALIKVESYVDCTIVVDDQVQFKAHRVVLAANSPYFQTILQDVPMDHCSIIFPGVKAFEMRALLEYMYTGEVNVTQSQIPNIMRIAEELEVKGLFDMADLKEKFHKLSEEHSDRSPHNPYTSSGPYAATASASVASSTSHNGKGDMHEHGNGPAANSSSVISTSSNISPSAAPSSSSSPPYNAYKSPYSSLYSKSPAPGSANGSSAPNNGSQSQSAAAASAQVSNADRAQWPLSPSTAAAMLSSVYESASDMNPLKRKKLSSISSMLMQRDTPILRNVLAQANPADSSQPGLPGLQLPSAGGKGDKGANGGDKNALAGHNNNHSFNGSDYGSQDKKYHDEPHSPYTDRSFEDDSYDHKGNYSSGGGGNFGSGGNQKPEWKRYKQYTRNDIMSAIQCVRDGMSALQASRKFGVPSRTLYDKVKKLGITTGRPMNRSMKRSPSSVETSAAFPYAHGYGQTEPLLSSMHDREERNGSSEAKEHHARSALEHHMAPTIPHPAAALLDHAFLQQALENRGGDIAGREALHAMALAAAAHAAANRMSSSPGPNGTAARSPSPQNFGVKFGGRQADHEMLLEREKERRLIESEMEREMERERERELERERARSERGNDDEEDQGQVEDLSVSRKESSATPPPARSEDFADAAPGVIRSGKAASVQSSDDVLMGEAVVKREIITDDSRAD